VAVGSGVWVKVGEGSWVEVGGRGVYVRVGAGEGVEVGRIFVTVGNAGGEVGVNSLPTVAVALVKGASVGVAAAIGVLEAQPATNKAMDKEKTNRDFETKGSIQEPDIFFSLIFQSPIILPRFVSEISLSPTTTSP